MGVSSGTAGTGTPASHTGDFFACGLIHGAATAAGTMPLLPPLFVPATRSYRRSPRPGRRAPVRQPLRAGDADRECGACTVRRRRRHDRSECHEIDRLQRGIARDTRTQRRPCGFAQKPKGAPSVWKVCVGEPPVHPTVAPCPAALEHCSSLAAAAGHRRRTVRAGTCASAANRHAVSRIRCGPPIDGPPPGPSTGSLTRRVILHVKKKGRDHKPNKMQADDRLHADRDPSPSQQDTRNAGIFPHAVFPGTGSGAPGCSRIRMSGSERRYRGPPRHRLPSC